MPTPSRIAFLINSLEFGGAQRVFIDDANDFIRAGFAVSFYVLYGVTGEHPFEREIDPAVSVTFLHATGPFDIPCAAACARDLRASGASVMISTLNDGNIFARWVKLAYGRGLRLIQREANAPSTKTLLQRTLDVVFWWIPNRILALSVETQGSLMRLPFARGKVTLLPNAVAIPALPERTTNAPLVILSIGRLTDQKNYALLLSALGTLARTGVSFTAKIAGEGYLRDALIKQVREEGLEGRVEFLGHVPHEEAKRLYASSDIFVSSSRWEGSPNVVLEAMAYGLAIVATNVGGVPDLIRDGKEGLLIASGDGVALTERLTNLLENADLRSTLGMSTRARAVRDFSREARFVRLRAIVAEA